MPNLRSFLLISLLYLFGISAADAQLRLRLGESFLQGENIKKVIITYDDHTVWALTTSGKVYYKPVLAEDFLIFAQTTGELVDDLAGYSEQDIYFSLKPKRLIHIKNGNKSVIPLNDLQITRINGIAVLYNSLMIATDQHLYKIIRNDSAVMFYDIYNLPDWDIREFEITKSGIKGVEFKTNFDTNNRCGWSDGKSIVQQIHQTIYSSTIPQHTPYGNVNCTLCNYDPNDPTRIVTGVNNSYQYWGTSNGLYIHYWGQCDVGLRQPIVNEHINSIEELKMFNALASTIFVLAASNTGLFYTEKFIECEIIGRTPIEEVRFKKLPGLTASVRNFVVDNRSFSPGGNIHVYNCENEIWLATDQGVKKLHPELDGTIYQNKALTRFSYDKTPDTDTEDELIFTLCGNETLEVNANLTNLLNSGAVSIKWSKDGADIPEWAGKSIVKFVDQGNYRAELTATCEGVKMHSKRFVIKKEVTPEITFNYPPVISMCEGQSKELSTINKPGYNYQWFRNDTEIAGAIMANFQVNSAGNYRVEVSNCAGSFITSATVKIGIPVLQVPVITADKPAYCTGDVALLKIDNAQNYKTHWYKDGVEIMALKDKTEISASSTGIYEAAFENTSGCQKRSQQFNLQISPFPVISINTAPTKSICYGESATLSILPVQNATYKWNTGATTPEIQVNRTGDYFVEVTSAFGCTTRSNTVNVSVNDQIMLSTPLESKICTISGEEVILIAEPGYLHYSWNGFTSSDNTFTVNRPGDYQVTVTDANGCTAAVIYKVVPWCKEITMANAFSPNGDGVNELWHVMGLENDPGATIMIYNRYGTLMFQTKGTNPVWDGKYKGADAPAGIYYYQIKSTQSNKPLKGSITLIR